MILDVRIVTEYGYIVRMVAKARLIHQANCMRS